MNETAIVVGGACVVCRATRHREDNSRVTWRCIQCGGFVCRTCCLTILDTSPPEYYEQTYCSQVCRFEHENDGSLEGTAKVAVVREEQRRVYNMSVDDLRRRGWHVAAHYDVQVNDRWTTFWLFAKGHVHVHACGATDAEALTIIEERIGELG